MVIERTESEVIIRLPADVKIDELQDMIDYLAYKESTSKSEATQEDVDELANKVKLGWWSKNRSRLVR